MSTARQGELFIAVESFLWALMPVITIYISPFLPPLWAFFFNTLFATALFAFTMFVGKRFGELKNRAGHKDVLLVSFWIMVLFMLYFLGLNYTTASNAAVIMFLQVLFAFIYFNVFGKEPISRVHQLGALFMTIGAILVLFPEDFSLNKGDLIILLASMVAPIANRYQQRARVHLSAQTVLFVRSLLSLPFIAIVAYLHSGAVNYENFKEIFWILLFSGVVVLGTAKILWIEGIYRISITKASAIAATGPVFTMIFAYFLLKEIPTLLQLIGIIPVVIGGVLITRKVNE